MPKTIDIVPVTGYMDTRSSPDQVPFGGYRYVLNWGVTQKNKLCRITGWQRLLDRVNYNNQDFHYQLFTFTGETVRKPLTFLFEAKSTRKTTKLLAGTENMIGALNVSTGNWKIIAKNRGSTGTRFRAAQMNDTTIISNDYDTLASWNFDGPLNQTTGEAVEPIPDLVAMGVTRAGVVIAWRGLMILANLTINGQVFSNRVMWSDFKKPLSYQSSANSLAGNADLDPGEAILAAKPLGNVLLLYTQSGIWEVNASGEAVFIFSKRYDPEKSGEACLKYRFTLISAGDNHLFMGRDGIYRYNLYMAKPDLVDWIHRGDGLLFSDLNSTDCDVHVAGYNSFKKEAYFSWAKASESVPGTTFAFNTEFPFSGFIDHGFSAFVDYAVSEPVASLEDFLLQHCICTLAQFNAATEDEQEGGQCTVVETVVCNNQPTSFYTTETKALEDGIVTENWDKVSPDANSMCGQLGNLTLEELCSTLFRSDECAAQNLFLAASSVDKCIKMLTDVLYRHECVAFTGCGTYVKRGYKSRQLSGPLAFKDFKDSKRFTRLELELEAETQAYPARVEVRIGIGATAVDPLLDRCPIRWFNEDYRLINCQTELTEAQHASEGTIPDDSIFWGLFYEGRFLYFDFIISNPDIPLPELPDTGGAVCLSRISFDVEKIGRA